MGGAGTALRVRFGATAVVCCLHGVEKRRVTQLVADVSREQVKECPCCANLYPTEPGDPAPLCHDCRPRSAA